MGASALRTAWLGLLFAAVSLGSPVEVCRTKDDSCWANKAVYQVITDRFAIGGGNHTPCDDLRDYCGGTWRGILENLDYIEGLGVDAIWLSPIVANMPKGYHGYWARSLTELNPHFGTREDLTALINECHRRGLKVMVDVVANHMGQKWSDIPHIHPFDSPEHYHNCDRCVAAGGGVGGVGCNGTICDCWVGDYDVPEQELYCQLYGLPDLDQDNAFVREKLFEFARDLVWIYGFDGLRIDTVPYVKQSFWKSFDYAAQRAFSMGEVSSHENYRVYTYVESGTLNSIINYPLYYQLLNTFMQLNESVVMADGTENTDANSMVGLSRLVAEQRRLYGDEKVKVLGNFAECHDVDRLRAKTDDVALRKAMILYVLAAEGISLIYYGEEQDLAMADFDRWGSDARRLPLWTTSYSTYASPNGMYDFIARINLLKKRLPPGDFKQAVQEELLVTEDMYVFQRGQVVVALTNAGSSGGRVAQSATALRFAPGTLLCNIYSPGDDCLAVGADGQLEIELLNGEAKVYAPQAVMPDDRATWWSSQSTVWWLLAGCLVSAACLAVVVSLCFVRRRHSAKYLEAEDTASSASSSSTSTRENAEDRA